jgi:hypothetical protein
MLICEALHSTESAAFRFMSKRSISSGAKLKRSTSESLLITGPREQLTDEELTHVRVERFSSCGKLIAAQH